MLPIVTNFLLTIHIIVSLLIILLVLMQRPKNEGLGAAFGGGMTENLFGAQTTNVLQTITRWLGAIFFSLTLLLSWLYVKETNSRSTLQKRLSAPTVIPATPAPVPPKDAPTSLPSAVSEPVSPLDAIKAELEKAGAKVDMTKEPAPGAKPAPEAGKPAEMPKTDAPAPAPDAAKPAPAPAPEAPKPAPAPEAAKPAPAPAPDAAKPEPAPDAAKPAPSPDAAKPAPLPEAAKPAPTPDAAKPESAPAPAPEKAPEAPKQ